LEALRWSGAEGATAPDAARWGADDVVGTFSGAGRSTEAASRGACHQADAGMVMLS